MQIQNWAWYSQPPGKKKKRIKKARLGLRKLEALASAIKKNNNNARKVSLQQTE